MADIQLLRTCSFLIITSFTRVEEKVDGMSASNSVAPVIIKRKKVVSGDGHHGGAWKVAYADFVTAMMAFFMLMWLLNATTEQQRKGIADYFNPTIPVNRISGGRQRLFRRRQHFFGRGVASGRHGRIKPSPDRGAPSPRHSGR